jgi:hypothetical protein
MQWVASDLQELLRQQYGATRPLAWARFDPVWHLLSIFLFGIYIWWLTRIASNAPGGKLDIRVEPVAKPCRGLILFLSRPRNRNDGPDQDAVFDSLGGPEEKDSLAIQTNRDKLKGPWRMPIEAVAHHVETLQYIVVIFPKIEPNDLSAGNPNIKFCQMLGRLLAYRTDPPKIIPHTPDQSLGSGTDFLDPHQVLSAVESAKSLLLNEKNLRPEDIIIDITGGQKVTSGIAAASAFDDRLRSQYVDTNTYVVAAYDLDYVPYGKSE